MTTEQKLEAYRVAYADWRWKSYCEIEMRTPEPMEYGLVTAQECWAAKQIEREEQKKQVKGPF